MSLTNFPNGITSFGLPVLGSGSDLIPPTTGSVFFVSSTTGANGNSGKTPSEPFATVDYAVGKCTASKGDIILCLPGHTESISSATSLVLDVAGVSVIGLGAGSLRPTFTYATATTATIPVSAANVAVKNCIFVANLDNMAAAFTLSTAKDFLLEGNSFRDTSSSLHFLQIVVTGTTDNAVDGLRVINNRYEGGLAIAPGAFVSILGHTDRVSILGNFTKLASTDDEGSFLTLADHNLTNAEIGWNKHFVTGSTGALVGIFITGSGTASTGFVHNNYVTSLDTTTELIATAGTGFAFINNYYTGTADASGKLWPTVDGA